LLISAQTTMELYGAHPEKAQSFRIKYTDDIDVKFQFQDKTLLVSLDVDSEKIISKTPLIESAAVSEEELEFKTDEDEETFKLSELLGETTKKGEPFYMRYMYHILGGIAALILLFAIFSIMSKKGKKKKPLEEEIEFEEDEEELEEIVEEEESVQ